MHICKSLHVHTDTHMHYPYLCDCYCHWPLPLRFRSSNLFELLIWFSFSFYFFSLEFLFSAIFYSLTAIECLSRWRIHILTHACMSKQMNRHMGGLRCRILFYWICSSFECISFHFRSFFMQSPYKALLQPLQIQNYYYFLHFFLILLQFLSLFFFHYCCCSCCCLLIDSASNCQ